MRAVVLRRIVIALFLVLSLLTAAGCGADSRTAPDSQETLMSSQGVEPTPTTSAERVRFAKTKFVLHAGLASGAVHRYVWKPYQEGGFRQGVEGRTTALVKAGLASAFAYHELVKAREAAQGDPALAAAINPLWDKVDGLRALPDRLKGGDVAPSDIMSAANLVDQVAESARGQDVEVREIIPPASIVGE